MIRTVAVVLSLFFAAGALAQTGDLRVTIDVPRTARLGDVVTLTATVENLGPGVARNVRASLRIIPGLQCNQPDIRLGDLAAGETKVVTCSQEVLDYGLFYLRSEAGAASDPSEPNELRANNSVQAYTDRVDLGTELAVQIEQIPNATRPGLPVPLTVVYSNRSRTTATNATLTLTISEGSFASLPANCTAAGNRAVCQLGNVEPSPNPGGEQYLRLPVILVAPDRSEARWSLDVEVRADQADENPANDVKHFDLVNYRTFYVREATEGALREALLSAGSECGTGGRCLVAFRIPNAADTKWHTIRLASELELLQGRLIDIDGTTQTGYFGNTNPEGPEIELDGSALTAGDGLRIPARCGISVRGLALNGFPHSAIFIHDGPHACPHPLETLVERNYIGTDPTGTQAKPNGRGIFSAAAHRFRAVGNVVSGNRHSGVFVERGTGTISGNVIGLNRTHDAPLPNQASGVYIGPGGSGTDVNDNYIGFNAHFGVAIDRGADRVALPGNSFQANGGAAIDWGLDGPEQGGRVPAPSIRNATYADGVTTIEVEAGFGGTFPFVSIYASDAPDPSGYGEGQYYLGRALRSGYRLQVPLDLRGKWISATLTEVIYLGFIRTDDDTGDFRTTTSEMSRAVEVQ